eukprot:m.433374 g.433374  ORF g.433374 m.433374 type:complete len:311 (-) comp21417_c1_seq1:187-1119(-)
MAPGIGVSIMAITGVCVALPLGVQVLATILSRTLGKQNPLTKIAVAIERQTVVLRGEKLVLAITFAMPITAIWMHWSRMIMHKSTEALVLLHVVPSVWINSGMIFNLLMASCVCPGRPTNEDQYKCRSCKKPALDMDHHCIFTANCVGKLNYGYFFGFLFWGWVATMYAVWLTTVPGRLCPLDEYRAAYTCTHAEVRTLLVVSAVSMVAVSLLMALVVVLLFTGQTIRGFLKGSPPALAVCRGWSLLNVEARLGPRATWYRILIPGVGITCRRNTNDLHQQLLDTNGKHPVVYVVLAAWRFVTRASPPEA